MKRDCYFKSKIFVQSLSETERPNIISVNDQNLIKLVIYGYSY